MLMIRLQRRGKKNQALYRLAVGEKHSKLDGQQLEYLGWYDPHKDKYSFDKERVLYWMSKGAKLSPTVNNLLIKYSIIEGKKMPVHNKPKKSAKAEAKKEEKKEVKKEEKKEEKPAEAPKE